MRGPEAAWARRLWHSVAGRCWRAFLRPGVRLANRWSFTTKAVTAGALMSAVVIGGGMLYGLSLSRAIDASTRELAALEHVRRGMALLRDLAQRRASASNALVSPGAGQEAQAASPAGLARRAEALAAAACPSSDSQARLYDAAQRVAALETGAAAERSFPAYTMLARELLGCLEETGRRSGIFGDRQVDYLAFALVRDLPVVIETVAKQAAVQHIPNEELTLYAAGAQLIVTDGLERIRAVLARLGEAAELEADAPLRRLIASLERGLLAVDYDGQLPFALVERDGFALADALCEHLGEHLQQRIDRQYRSGLRILALAVLFAGLCAYLVLGTVLAIRKSLNALERGSQAFCENHLEHRIAVDSRDEFRAVAGNFNRIAERTVDLLRQLDEQARRARQDLERKVEERTGELSRANQCLSDTVEKLTAAQEALVRSAKMAALGNLVAGVAHEVNTPLGLAYTITTHMQEQLGALAAKHKAGRMRSEEFGGFLDAMDEGLKYATGNLRRAAALIESFKQVAVDQSADARRRFDLESYLREVIGSVHSILRKGGHRVEIAVAGKVAMDSYPGALAQVLTNIVSNAVTHAFDGRQGGVIGVAVSQESAERCRIVITDDGAGMPDEVVQRIFDPFFTTRRGRGGTGLGMHIVYNLVVQRLGGEIACVSTPGQGSTFVLSLPTTAPPAAGGTSGSGRAPGRA